jgi:glyoxylase-like metal-dependent hydrolase (beta-lactamase superfamily II)
MKKIHVLCGLLCAAVFPSAVFGAAPRAQGGGAGVWQFELGGLQVSALSDGKIDLPVRVFSMPGGDAAALFAAAGEPDPVPTSINAYLIQMGAKNGNRLVLVDAGRGGREGEVLRHLEAAGYKPGQVDDVLITHMHLDHIGGLLKADGKPAFPNAQIWVNARESAFWLDPAKAGELYGAVARIVKPYQEAGHWKLFNPLSDEGMILPGISPIAEYGHTPGHTGYYVVAGDKARLCLWGDVVHNAAVQFAHPEVGASFDNNRRLAEQTRKRMLERFANDPQMLVGGVHLPFPGLGHIKEADGRYAWVPLKPQ